MKKILGCLLGFTLMTGCAESLALLGPTSTVATGGNIAQSTFSSAVNYGVKKKNWKKSNGTRNSLYRRNQSAKKKGTLFIIC